MAISEAFAGSETVSTTEHSLTTDTAGPDTETSDGEFQVFLDLSALANGDMFVLCGYEKVQSADTQRKFFEFTFAHAQSTPNWVSPMFLLMHGWDFTLDKISGTDRAITWSIRKIDHADAPTAAAIADAVWDEATSGHTTSGTFGEQVKTDIDAILVDTGTTLDSNITSIKNKTDSLTFTVANQVDANIQYVNDVAVTGDGQAGTEWGP